MEILRMTQTTHPLYEKAMRLYRISFPYHEQREAASQAQILGQSAYHFDVFCDQGQFVGEALSWEIGDFLYIEHLCVEPSMRNRRYGQRMLEHLQARPLILEIDPPVDDISRRRRGFYARCGFVENPYPHVHPAYHRGYAGHKLVVMSCPDRLTSDAYALFSRYLQETIMNGAY